MGLGVENATARKNSTLTPKAILHQKYGEKASYRIEEVPESGEGSCPGLAIQQAGRILFKCHLELPEFSITSDAFTRKKDAQHSAAKLALEKLGCQTVSNNPTPEEAFSELIQRISYLFSNEFILTSHPLTNHFRAALMRQGDLNGFVPISVIVSYDQKTINLCKIIDAKVELEPSLMISIIIKAAKLTPSVCILDGELWMARQTSYSAEAIQALIDRNVCSTDSLQLEVICIPTLVEKPVHTLTLDISSDGYYLSEIASNLNVSDASRVFLSRNIGKTSSEMRLFSPVPELNYPSSCSLPETTDASDVINVVEQPLNNRATFLSGHKIHGNAILAVVAYKWNSSEIFFEHVSLWTFYRAMLGRVPTGNYKLSREAVLAAELPSVFTTRGNWRGSLPRELLCMICRYHMLSEPVFVEETAGIVEPPAKRLEVCRQPRATSLTQIGNNEDATVEVRSREDRFRCGVKILSRQNDLIIEYPPRLTYSKQSDAVQNAALKVLSWFNDFFELLDMCEEKVSSIASSYGIHVNSTKLVNEFQHYHGYLKEWSIDPVIINKRNGKKDVMTLFYIEGPESGNPPSQGSLVCISYAVTLMSEDDPCKEIIESNDQFEFEVGTGAVINQLEACVTQMSVNQHANFMLEAPSRDIILAAAGKSAEHLSQKSLHHYKVEYSVKLLGVTEPLEDRMEHAFFSPPLSKQRVEFAVKYINEFLATTLVDFGCGSGSLLDALLDQTTTLEKVAGVDISPKGLTRAAKLLHSKLGTSFNSMKRSIGSLELYEGSILEFDSRLYGYDIGTCLEVIEHMEEDQATAFGDLVLREFCPRLLIISTPNYEYNIILHGDYGSNKEEDPEGKAENVACKFRNHDHKFEWTREQFQCWASMLAARHSYSVEYSGVGGSLDEPGFASQIAVFRKLELPSASTNSENVESQPYEVVWRWQSGSVCTI